MYIYIYYYIETERDTSTLKEVGFRAQAPSLPHESCTSATRKFLGISWEIRYQLRCPLLG